MGVVDKEGKIFGKINIADILIVAFVLLLAYAGFLYIFGESNAVFVSILAENQPNWVYENLRAGDKELGSFTGRAIGEVVDIKTIPSLGGNENILLVMKIDASNKNGVLFYKDEILKIGKEIEIATDKVFLKGTTISIDQKKPENLIRDDPKIIEVFAKDVPVSIAQELNKGNFFEQNGKKVFEITDIQKIGNSYTTYSIRMKIFLDSKNFNNKLLFSNQAIQKNGTFRITGQNFEIETNIFDIFPIEEKNKYLENSKIEKIVYFEDVSMPRELASLLKPGDGEFTLDGAKISEILAIQKLQLTETQLLLRVKAKVEAEIVNGLLMYKGNELKAGNSAAIYTKKLNFNGTISGIYDSLAEIPVKKIENAKTVLLVKNIPPWIASNINVGSAEKDLDTEKNIVEITSKTETPAIAINVAQSGEIIKTIHPENKDLKLEATIQLEKDQYGFLFKGKYIKVNSQITLIFPKATAYATIVEISNE